MEAKMTNAVGLKMYSNSQNKPLKYGKLASSKKDKANPLTTRECVKLLLEGNLKRKVCRYCLNITTSLSELDEILEVAVAGATYEVTIRSMIASFYPFQITEYANLPNKICNKCLDKAVSSYLFTQQCERAERALRNCLNDINEKFDKLDPIEKVKKRGRQKLNPNHNVLYVDHKEVISYAEPIINIINLGAKLLEEERMEINDFECPKCWQVFSNIEELVNHEQIHPNYMWYNCRLCGKSFVKHSQYKKHLRQDHVDGKELRQQKSGCEFKCNECGQVSGNFSNHLQHMEKHKFKTIFEHLMKRRMDDLCGVCMDKGKNMIDLNETCEMHGGYPELTGEKTMYNILVASFPEKKSYKYQELHLAKEANIIRLVKKTADTPILYKDEHVTVNSEIAEKFFVMSMPIIISKIELGNIDNVNTLSFIFSEPLKDIHYNSEDIKKNVDNNSVIGGNPGKKRILHKSDNEDIDKKYDDISEPKNDINNYHCELNIESNTHKDSDKKYYDDICEIKNDINYHCELNIENDIHKDSVKKYHDEICEIKNDINNYQYELNIDNDTYKDSDKKYHNDVCVAKIDINNYECKLNIENNQEIDKKYHADISEAKTNVKQYHHESNNKNKPLIKKLCNKCWIFNEAKCEKCIYSIENSSDLEVAGNSNAKYVSKQKAKCNLCYLFKNIGICDYCKRNLKDDIPMIDMAYVEQSHSENEEKICNQMRKRKIDGTNSTSFSLKWQCHICLTNNINRETCSCCELVKPNGSEQINLKMFKKKKTTSEVCYNFLDSVESIQTLVSDERKDHDLIKTNNKTINDIIEQKDKNSKSDHNLIETNNRTINDIIEQKDNNSKSDLDLLETNNKTINDIFEIDTKNISNNEVHQIKIKNMSTDSAKLVKEDGNGVNIINISPMEIDNIIQHEEINNNIQNKHFDEAMDVTFEGQEDYNTQEADLTPKIVSDKPTFFFQPKECTGSDTSIVINPNLQFNLGTSDCVVRKPIGTAKKLVARRAKMNRKV